MKKAALKNFAIFAGKISALESLLIKLQRDFNIMAFAVNNVKFLKELRI